MVVTGVTLIGLFFGCGLAGCLAAILGLGGGVFVVPILTLGAGVEIVPATAASLVCCLATSAGGSVAFDKAKLADFALVAHLEVFAGVGALVAAYVGAKRLIPQPVLYGLFALVVLYAALRMLRKLLLARREEQALARFGAGDGAGTSAGSPEAATAEGAPTDPAAAAAEAAVDATRNYPLAFGLAWVAGLLSGLLGIGGGPVKVPLQTEVLGLRLPVALANSNVMIGITTGFGAAVHFGLGTVDPLITAPCALGMAGGAYVGGRLAPKIKAAALGYAFVVVLAYVGTRMAWRALGS